MNTTDELLSFDLDDFETLDPEMTDDSIVNEAVDDTALIDDEVHVIGGNDILADDGQAVPDTIVMDVNSEQVFDYDMADFNDDGMIDVDDMFNLHEQDEEDPEFSLDDDMVDDDDVYIVGLEDISEDETSMEAAEADVADDEISLDSEEFVEDSELDDSEEMSIDTEESFYEEDTDIDMTPEDMDLSLF